MTAFLTNVIVAAVALFIGRAARGHGSAALPTGPPVSGGSSRAPTSSNAGHDEYFLVGDNFFCDTARSPDGRYLVDASDGHIDERGRQRKGAWGSTSL